MGGFRFGMTFDQANAVCNRVSSVGLFTLEGNHSLNCLATPMQVGFVDELAFLDMCNGRVCRIHVLASKSQNPQWEATTRRVARQIASKYGPPSCVSGVEARWAWEGPQRLGGLIQLKWQGDLVFLRYSDARGIADGLRRLRDRL